MQLARKYIMANFNRSFLTIFITLFSISSISILIKTANLSSNFALGFFDFVQIYSYFLPQAMFTILPIVFFVAAVLALSRMSLDSETLAMFSFGMKMSNLYFAYVSYAFFFSIMLLVVSLGLMPVSYHKRISFVDLKSLTKGVNFSNSSEFGQAFGNWFVFVNRDGDDQFSNIILFNNEDKSENIIIAKKARLDENLDIELTQGRAYHLSGENIFEIDFKEMFIANTLGQSREYFSDIVAYWMKMQTDAKVKKRFITYILFSIFPLISIHGIIALGLLKPRISKKGAVWHAFIYVLIYIFIAQNFYTYGLISIPAIAIIWMGFSYALYYLRRHNHIP